MGGINKRREEQIQYGVGGYEVEGGHERDNVGILDEGRVHRAP
jgi:hypothetical protein